MPAADYAYHKKWRLDRDRGLRRTTDAGPVRAHINALLSARLSVRAIADRAGVSAGTISGISRGLQQTVRVQTARRILALSPKAALERPNRAGLVLNSGARWRIQALLALGWRHADISVHMGTRTKSSIILHQVGGWIARETHDAVRAAYDALSGRPGPSDRTRARAARLGYAPRHGRDDVMRLLTPAAA